MASDLLKDLPKEKYPRHIAIIMDGNGRWAKQRGRMRLFGHRQGISSVRETVRECHRLGIGYLTLYAFSTENWNRPPREIRGLWGLLKYYVQSELPELKRNGVRLRVIGDFERLPADVRKIIQGAIDELAGGKGLALTIALSYSSRDEIVGALRKIAREVKENSLDVEAIDDDLFSSRLMTSELPDPDLLIRTSGEFRISNFLLWQLAYSEIYITPVLWPDFSPDELHKAIAGYADRERRYGKTSDQIRNEENS